MKISVLVMAGATAMLLAACGGNGGAASPSAPTETPFTTPSSTPVPSTMPSNTVSIPSSTPTPTSPAGTPAPSSTATPSSSPPPSATPIPSDTPSASGTPTATTTPTTSGTPPGSLPLGDGKLSTTPEVGYLMSCIQQFPKTKTHSGPWIQGDVWYPTQKIAVQGSVDWPTHQTSITISGDTRMITSNNLPDHPTGVFPIQPSDPAYQYDTNPNAITAQDILLTLPVTPTEAANATCVPLGLIGFATDGVAIFNAVDDSGHDAVAHEVQDSCDAHPNGNGQYHYHGPSVCMPNAMTSGLVGYALDGFGIYGMVDAASGKVLHDGDLDACHGTTSPVMWDGQMVTMYHYVLTPEYPYTVGCFRGTPVAADLTPAQRNQIANFP